MKVVTVGLEELQKIMSDVIKSEVEPIKRLVANNEDNAGDGIGEVLTLEEAAKFVGISKSGMTQRVKSGTVPYIKNVNGRNVFTSKYLKLAKLAPDQATIEALNEQMYKEYSKQGNKLRINIVR